MHNGDNLMMFCSDLRRQPNLFWDILHALIADAGEANDGDHDGNAR
jgi:hypothetical protein